ncbi:hypothetical protein PPERSA_09884 [Pseudocohnilembus persalinus]|uniref:Methyltransferase type 11 domain-containing protein n=1 Tax=Pseudocohnilembus persalinus TaxID=266149 RepID=A0A0V0QUU5_PSEPJ|nr:hypothetical protein PPERSA_09884 [Pseudocohnilembus persalinus]|eukprot:KRX05744.1 hypothetical protein PPERSA_09884 [Pseudocohnilembus persalinus]
MSNNKSLEEYNFYQFYADHIEKYCSANLYTLQQFANIQKMDRILEAGAGTGSIFPLIIQGKKREAEYHTVDISNHFLMAQKQRLLNLEEQIKKGHSLQNKSPVFQIPQNQEKNNESQEFNYQNSLFNIFIHNMNMEKLNFPDNYFDGYFGSLVFHHSDLIESLKQAKRVLKPGGKLGLVEFTEKENKKYYEPENPVVEELFKKLYAENYKGKWGEDHQESDNNIHESEDNKNNKEQQQNSEKHQNHQSDENKDKLQVSYKDQTRENLKQQLQKNGFKNIYIYDTFIPLNYTRENFFWNYFLGKEPKSHLSQNEQNEIKDQIWDYFVYPNKNDQNKELRDYPNGMEVFCVLAIKI